MTEPRTQSLSSIVAYFHQSVILFILLAGVFMLSACNESTDDSDDSVQLTAPPGLNANTGNTHVSLNWDPVARATSYNLYFSTVSGTAINGQVIIGTSDTSYIHTGLTNSTTYYYVVRAVGIGGVESQPSSEVSATPFMPSDGLIMGRYQLMGSQEEIIQDVVTGLEWQRCSVGQTWNQEDLSCDGNATTHDWGDAIELTAQGGFRVPTVEELRTIGFCSDTGFFNLDGCYSFGTFERPTIVLEAFPSTPSSVFWTSTRYDENHNSRVVSFDYGYSSAISHRTDTYNVRLVRVGE